jgi:hypothetical protein
MNIPFHRAKDLDAALMYAPPWVRDPGQEVPPRRAVPLDGTPPRIRREADETAPFDGDRAMVELQRRLALDPRQIPEPPAEGGSGFWRFALRLCAIAAVAAIAAGGIVLLPNAGKRPNEIAPSAIAPAAPAAAPPPQVAVKSVKLIHVHAPTVTAETMAPPVPQNEPAASTDSSPVAAVASASDSRSGPKPPGGRTMVLDDSEIATLIKRGKDFIMNGDFASARLLLGRAAEAGSADAALALGASFDPIIIRRLGAVGAEADAAQARQWYQKAVELGSPLASQQLANLQGGR